jgi:hypothetical protein
MKKSLLVLVASAATIALLGTAGSGPAAAEDSFIRVPLGLSYSSSYWWRGIELNGKDVGVAWANAGLELGSTGITLFAAAGLSEDYLLYDNTGFEDYRQGQKSLSEFDYGVSYSVTVAEKVSIGLGAAYIHYPYYDALVKDATDPSFAEGSLSVGLKVPLNPTLSVYYDYYVEESAAKTPRDEDYYARFSVSHDLLSKNDFTFTAGAWAGYYNNAYLEREGWSDAGLSLAIGFAAGDASFRGAAYYARSLSSDFQLEDADAGKMKNHFWSEFGVSYKI